MPLLEYHQSHINYEFRDHPKGNHGTLVLLHGFLEDSRMWKELTPNLEHIGSILMIDLPGHGKTSSFGYEHTMDFMAGCVRAVLDHLDDLGSELQLAIQRSKITTTNAAIAIPVTLSLIHI